MKSQQRDSGIIIGVCVLLALLLVVLVGKGGSSEYMETKKPDGLGTRERPFTQRLYCTPQGQGHAKRLAF